MVLHPATNYLQLLVVILLALTGACWGEGPGGPTPSLVPAARSSTGEGTTPPGALGADPPHTPPLRQEHSTDSAPIPHVLDPLKDMSAEKYLIHLLLDNYNRVGRHGRPVLNVTTPLKVFFALGLIQMDLDERHKILIMSMWTRYQWRDEYLTWNPESYGGVTSIRVETDRIWIPDITLYNTAQAEAETRKALAVISNDGVVTWFPHTIFRSSCSVDVTNFPFDSQRCHMWFGSWTHSSSEIDLRMGFSGGIDLSTFKSDYKESCSWEIMNVTALRKIMPSEQHQPNFAVLTFELRIRRKLVFSSYILTLPCVFLAFLTLVVFWLPPERPDRTGLAMSTFSSFMLLLLILVEAAPPTASSVPTLGVYYCFNMVIIMLSIILSSLVVNISRGSKSRVPRWLAYVTFNGSGNCLRRNIFRHFGFAKPNHLDAISENETITMLNSVCDATSATRNPNSNNNRQGENISALFELLPEDSRVLNKGLEAQMAEIKMVLLRIERGIDKGVSKENIKNDIHEDWRKVAIFLDRVFFVLYVILIVVSLTAMFPRPL